jgi:hypothetical protein
MIIDDFLEFADAVSVAAAAGTALIGDVIDTSAVHRDLGNGKPVWFVVTVDTEIVAASAGTVKIQLVSDAQAAIAVDGSASVHLDSGTFVTNVAASNDNQLNAGAVMFAAPLPIEGRVYERYLGVLCITATATTTAGKINAFLTYDPPIKSPAYPKAVS